MRTSVERHVVVAHHVAEDEARAGHRAVVLVVERVVVRDDVAAADALKRHVAAGAHGRRDIVCRGGQFRELLAGPDLRVGRDDEAEARIVARAPQQFEVAASVGGHRVEVAHDAVLDGGVVTRGYGEEDEAVRVVGRQRVSSFGIGPCEALAVGDPDVRDAPAVAAYPAADADVGGTCPGAQSAQQQQGEVFLHVVVPICIFRESASTGTVRAARGSSPSTCRP